MRNSIWNSLLVMALLAGGLPALADNAELITAMRKQQKQAETQLVRMWGRNQRGKDMEKILSDYVVREIRLRSISGKPNTGSLLSALVKSNPDGYETPQAIVQAMVVEYYRRQGVDVSDNRFVVGNYLIRNQDLQSEADAELAKIEDGKADE